MVKRAEYDFLNWTSFPSSMKLYNDEADTAYLTGPYPWIAVTPGSVLTFKVKAKQEGIGGGYTSRVTIRGWDGTKIVDGATFDLVFPRGSFNWQEFTRKVTVPQGVVAVVINRLGVAAGIPTPTTTWFDDFKTYQDDALIYSNDFSNWDPVIGAGVGAGILGVVVPAVVRIPEPGVAYEYQKPILEKEPLLAAGLAGLGILVGGGIGLLTGLGIIPVPQIPALEAAPEGPGAPARLGKYQITG